MDAPTLLPVKPGSAWDLQDQFGAATTDTEREQIRQQLRDAGFSGIADTIGR